MASKKPTSKKAKDASRPNDPILEKVLAVPDDDALREVWADALQERGDPRGELIAIQLAVAGRPLTPAQDKRARSLLAKHAVEWLGPLSGVVMRRAALLFDRGLVTSCQMQIKSLDALRAAIGHPLWATVRKVWFCDRYGWDARIVPLLVHPAMRSLREITCIGVNGVFPSLATHERPLPFTSVWTFDDGRRARAAAPVVLRTIDAMPGLPALRRFGLTSHADDPSWIFKLPLVRQIETLGLTIDLPIGFSLEQAERLTNLRTLELRPDAITLHGAHARHLLFSFTRDENGRLSELSIARGGRRGPLAPRLVGMDASAPEDVDQLVSFLSDGLEHLETVASTMLRRIVVHAPEHRALRAPLTRFRNAEVVFV